MDQRGSPGYNHRVQAPAKKNEDREFQTNA